MDTTLDSGPHNKCIYHFPVPFSDLLYHSKCQLLATEYTARKKQSISISFPSLTFFATEAATFLIKNIVIDHKATLTNFFACFYMNLVPGGHLKTWRALCLSHDCLQEQLFTKNFFFLFALALINTSIHTHTHAPHSLGKENCPPGSDAMYEREKKQNRKRKLAVLPLRGWQNSRKQFALLMSQNQV